MKPRNASSRPDPIICTFTRRLAREEVMSRRTEVSQIVACLQAVVCIRARVRSPANPVAILDELVEDLGRARKNV